ncbi:MAG TPA: hypothetical protein PLF71_04940 [bacterium]|nr:MAG: hypothetical protein BWY14_00168 [Parcubacteria group bacterium ADurb.Bin192]HPN15423.1 hypothetical protein [bacterium]
MSKNEPFFHWKPFLMGLAVMALASGLIAGCYVWFTNSAVYKPYGRQAVFLTNGQVYFGVVQSKDSGQIVLSDIYYLQSDRAANNAANLESQQDIKLIKLGNELHGPEDRMEINRQHVLFIEDLKSDSKVVKAIQDFSK